MKTRLVATFVALSCLSGCSAGPERVPDREPLADCSTGPWADHCPEARWAREVAAAAGFSVTGDTGSALTIERSRKTFHLWAFTPEEPELRAEQLQQEGYGEKTRVDGIAAYGDGVRVTWKVYGLHVWLTNAGLGDLGVSSPGVADVVRASAEVPWP